jgi:hypothetical protein
MAFKQFFELNDPKNLALPKHLLNTVIVHFEKFVPKCKKKYYSLFVTQFSSKAITFENLVSRD